MPRLTLIHWSYASVLREEYTANVCVLAHWECDGILQYKKQIDGDKVTSSAHQGPNPATDPGVDPC